MSRAPAMSNTKSLSILERDVLQIIWERGECSAEQVRLALAGTRELKDSTVRTVLRRLEEKGYVAHRVENRTYIYGHVVAPQNAAVRAVRQIIESFCGGSVERLLVGMVDQKVLTKRQLRELAAKISESGPHRGGGRE